MRRYALTLVIGFVSFSGAVSQTAQPAPASSEPPATTQNAVTDFHDSRWFPIEKLDESLPSWLQFGGEYRARTEGQSKHQVGKP